MCALLTLFAAPSLLAAKGGPEIDPAGAAGGLALALGSAALLWERRRRRR